MEKQEEKALKKRIAAQGWLTRASKDCGKVLGDMSILEEAEYLNLVETFGKRLASWDEIQAEYEQCLDITVMESELDKAADFREECQKPLLQLQTEWAKLHKQTNSVNPMAVDGQGNPVNTTFKMNLPKLELPKFSGDVMEFTTFWQQFEACVDKQNYPLIAKFNYLVGGLKGEARHVLDGLPIIEENYSQAKEIIQSRYGRPEVIIFSHVQALLSLEAPKGNSWKLLSQFRDKLVAHVRALAVYGIKSENFGVILTPIIVSRMPEELRSEWSRGSEGKEANLDFLMEFLEKEIGRRERCVSFCGLNDQSKTEAVNPNRKERRNGSAVALHSVTQNDKPTCAFCQRTHKTHRCYSYLDLQVNERQKKAENCRLCFKCLSAGHVARDCNHACIFCGGKHHVTLCFKSNPVRGDKCDLSTQNKVPKSNSNTVLASVNAPAHHVSNNTVTLLPTAKVRVKGCDNSWHVATLLFDSGSDKSYVSSELVRRVKPKFLKTVSNNFNTFGGRKNMSRSRVFEVSVKGGSGGNERPLQLKEVPVICLPLTNPRVESSILEKFSHLYLAEEFEEGDSMSIDILIGQDLFWSLILGGTYRPDGCDIVAQESLFGWVLSGSNNGGNSSGVALLNIGDISDNVVRSFWDLESIGVKEKEVSADPLLEQFNKTVEQTESGRYKVGLLWKDSHPILLNNERSAEHMLTKLENKLENDTDLKRKYDQVLKEMEERGFIVEVEEDGEPNGKVFYLPHRPHVRESSVSTKVRPVFNASFKGANGVSLNDCLEQGPNLNPNVSEVLLRFRRWRFVVSADVEKAFLQIELKDEDQDVHRFLWRGRDGHIRKLKFARVTFGINCSPFLLSATIRYHLSLFPPSVVIEELSENLYVDDFLSGADTELETQKLLVQAKEVMESAGMNLTKWSSNESAIIGGLSNDGNQSPKVLGVSWDQSKDCFTLVGIQLPEIDSLRYSKRVVLSLMARIFDPLGFVLPFTVSARFLFQDVWRLGVTWDEDLPVECQSVFRAWLTDLELLKGLSISRQFMSFSWSDISRGAELHAFGDASLKGYGACVYLRYRSPSGECLSTLVRSCARVAPLERKTLPRLELLGALVTAQLLCSVIKDLRLPSSIPYTCWSDSMVALGWIRSRPAKWKPWVANRVAQIQSMTNPQRWRHIAGVENPADLVTRGIEAERLAKLELWWSGPSILRDEQNPDSPYMESPKEEVISLEDEVASMEVEKKKDVCLVSFVSPKMFEFERWSTLNKTYRIIGLVLRFVGGLKRSETGDFDSKSVRDIFVKILQRQYFHEEILDLESKNKVSKDSKIKKLTPFVDEDGFLRATGRLQLSELAYESKHPRILPCCHGTLLLVRFVHYSKNHAGVDTMITWLKANFEILGLRKLAKKVKRSCVLCRRFDARACNEPTAPLPRVRVTRAPVFTVTGLDFAGPVFCLDHPGDKFYICLFVCGVVRAVHLELVDSLTSSDFILAFRRFAALKRVPSIVYSDNGTNLVGGQKILCAYLGPSAPEWRFICPRSPWWGGWWERLVRSVKGAIRKTIGRECLTKVEFQTCISEVAASINSRPLTFVGSDIENQSPLTPNHFLSGQGNQSLESRILEDPDGVSVENLRLREQEMLQRLNDFWEVWSSLYLRNLPRAYQRFRKEGNLQIGSVVLIKEDNLPRLKWAMGVVEQLHVGRDGIARSADLRTSTGVKTRPIQRLFDLEISDYENAKVPEVGINSSSATLPDVSDETEIDSSETHDESCQVSQKRRRRRPLKFNDFICSYK